MFTDVKTRRYRDNLQSYTRNDIIFVFSRVYLRAAIGPKVAGVGVTPLPVAETTWPYRVTGVRGTAERRRRRRRRRRLGGTRPDVMVPNDGNDASTDNKPDAGNAWVRCRPRGRHGERGGGEVGVGKPDRFLSAP